MLLIDTSVAVELREGANRVGDWFERLVEPPLLSIITVVELEGGVVKVPVGALARREALNKLYRTVEVLEFGWKQAQAYAVIVDCLGFSRPKIIDRMIAAQAIVAEAKLATLNARDFRDIPGLIVENWSI